MLPKIMAWRVRSVFEVEAVVSSSSSFTFRLQIVAESLGLTARCLCTILLLIYRPEWGLFNFCVAQLAQSGTPRSCLYGLLAMPLSPTNRCKLRTSCLYIYPLSATNQ